MKKLFSLILILSFLLITTTVPVFAATPAGYVLATDADFGGETDGSFWYIGSDEYVIIPHVIKGVSITKYDYMFVGNPDGIAVKGVYSDNPNITSVRGMFYHTYPKSLDLSHFDLSTVTDITDMFAFTFTTQVFTKTQADADRLSAIDFNATVTFTVKNQQARVVPVKALLLPTLKGEQNYEK